MKKTKVSTSKLYDSMEERGITFNNHTKQQAIIIMEHTNYYYKLSSFRKNFEKNKAGKYINCDFENLIDLATIDMHVRNYLLQMSLSIEHFVKTEISRLITVSKIENGYDIVYEYEQRYTDYFDATMDKFEMTRYQKDMLKKRGQDLPIWVLMEHMDYSALCKLVTLYYFKYNKVLSLEKAHNLMISSRYIRNACAHNSTFILEWFNHSHMIKNNPSGIKSTIIDLELIQYRKYAKVNDMVATFILLKSYASEGTIQHFYTSGKDLLKRWKNYHTYENIPKIKKMYDILEKMVDFLEK